MKILLQTYAFWPAWGGVQKHIVLIYKYLKSLNHRVRLATSYRVIIDDQEKYWIGPWTNKQGVTLNRFGFNTVSRFLSDRLTHFQRFTFGIHFFFAYLHYLIYLMIIRPQIVHLIFIDIDALFAVKAKRLFRYKIITTCQGNDILQYDHQKTFKKNLIASTLKGSDIITTVSREMAERVRSILNNEHLDIRIIPNGIELDRTTIAVSRISCRRYFIFVGRLFEKKNPLFLISTFIQFHRKHPEYDLILIGTGSLMERSRETVLQAGLEDKIQLLGQLRPDDALSWIRNAEALILPSVHGEGCPFVILEALALGTPVIASNTAGIREVITDAENGLLFQSNNMDQLILCMERIIQAPELRAHLIQNGILAVKGRYDSLKIMGNYLSLYDEVLKGRIIRVPAS